MIFEFNGHTPKIGNNVFIAPPAVIIGNVDIQNNASIWYGTVLRADLAGITIGESSNIQDNCTLHSDLGKPVVIGSHVSVGHNAVIHAATIEDYCLIGIHAVVLTDAVIKTGSVVAAGAVVRQRQVIGPYHLVTGVPAAMKKTLPLESLEKRRQTADNYIRMAQFHTTLKPS